MLVLSRKQNEAILVGAIRIVVVRIKGQDVRIGIEAPRDVAIVREEIAEYEPPETPIDAPTVESEPTAPKPTLEPAR